MNLDFENILNQVNDAIIAVDKEWKFIFANRRALKYSPNENIIGKNIWEEFPELKNTDMERCCREAMETGNFISFDFEGPRTHVFYKVSAHPSSEGLIVFLVDITDKKVVEDNLKKALNEKESLVKEAHHRIKNNLQLISSLLNFQLKKIKDENIKNIFRDTQNRITSIAIIHKSLYHSSSLDLVNIKTLLAEFAEDLADNLPDENKKIKIFRDIDEIMVNSDLAVSVSLILNELVTNSIKYAFKGMDNGEIIIELKDSKDYIELNVEDNGTGLPENFDFNGSDGIGFKVISALVEQNKGSLDYKFNSGSHFKIKFKKTSVTYKIK